MNSKMYTLREPKHFCDFGWYVGVAATLNVYLHDDLMLHGSTRNGSTSSGYFKTHQDATNAVNAYYLKWNIVNPITEKSKTAFDRAMKGI